MVTVCVPPPCVVLPCVFLLLLVLCYHVLVVHLIPTTAHMFWSSICIISHLNMGTGLAFNLAFVSQRIPITAECLTLNYPLIALLPYIMTNQRTTQANGSGASMADISHLLLKLTKTGWVWERVHMNINNTLTSFACAKGKVHISLAASALPEHCEVIKSWRDGYRSSLCSLCPPPRQLVSVLWEIFNVIAERTRGPS